ncbi:hypothetical protein FKM82_016346 [Ascaphus truei]
MRAGDNCSSRGRCGTRGERAFVWEAFVRSICFTNMLKNKQPLPVNIRATMQQQQQMASARNRRLAQQMENRPSVQAALKLKQPNPKDRMQNK